MDIRIQTGDILQQPSDLCVLGVLEGVPLPASVAGLLEPTDFTGRTHQSVLLYPRVACCWLV